MQWSYHLCSTITATTSKFKMAVEIGVFRLIREALYFCSTITATTSKFCWELQIDVSIIYCFFLIFKCRFEPLKMIESKFYKNSLKALYLRFNLKKNMSISWPIAEILAIKVLSYFLKKVILGSGGSKKGQMFIFDKCVQFDF